MLDRPVDAELAAVAARAAAQRSAENFPVALRVLPAVPRDQLARVYAFARFVDDIGDEADGDRDALLAAIARDVTALPTGRARLAPVAALAPVLRAHGIGIAPLLDLVEANRVDQRVHAYERFDDLLDYCALSAAPVGRLVLGIAGVDDAVSTARSDEVCAALQVLEHCQDVAEDARAGRVYLPAEDLRAHGVGPAELTASVTSPGLRAVVALQVARAGELLDAGPALVRGLHGWARVAVAGYVAGGLATAHALRAADHDVLARTITPGAARTAREAVALLAGRGGAAGGPA